MHRDDDMLIYPAIEFKDLIYAHQYGYQQANVPIRYMGGLIW